MFLVSALFIVSVCYLYTTGFEINNLAIIVVYTSKQLANTSSWKEVWDLFFVVLPEYNTQENMTQLRIYADHLVGFNTTNGRQSRIVEQSLI